MNDPKRYLVTGATGLIGKQLVARLIERGGHITALVRPASRARHQALLEGWRASARARGGALEVLEGDVTAPGLGLAPGALDWSRVDHVLHAAGLYRLDGDADALDRVNREGTANLLACLTREAGFQGVLHHVSSVGVAGDFAGELLEDALELGQRFASPYLESKYEAERLVRAAAGLRRRIYRPSAVVGHSRTGEMDRVDGPYYLLPIIRRLRDALPRWISIPARLRGAINMVPVDHVADVIDALAHRDGLDGQCFHVVDPDPPRTHETFNLFADAAGASRVRRPLAGGLRALVPGAAEMLGQLGMVQRARANWLRDHGVPAAVLESFNPAIRYSTRNRDRALAGAGLRCPPQASYVAPLWDYWLRNLDPALELDARLRRALAGAIVLITGASSGVGEAMAKQCAAAGARVVLVARREAELRRVVAEIREAGGAAAYYAADLSELQECDRVAERTRVEHGPVDVLINNAARSIRRPATESLERFHDYERVMQLNFFAAVRLIRAVLPDMRGRGRGHVINILTSGLALPAPRFSAYTASKAALGQLTDTLASELLDEGVEFTGVYLPWVRTPMMDASGKYKRTRAMTPEAAAAWALESVVKRPRRVMDGDTRRRYVLNTLAPVAMTRLMNSLLRVYADDEDAHPEFAADRALLKRFVPGRPM